ncbi:hypothetical protein [Ferrimonas balearica]|uniref:hypothetical protein n=1 Tax=Ferrimonas balearica TaxID=44012 RepID=UPI001C99D036|nr:hypothetical protein [Ferrimonas balearica]MBY5991255.1 hypothetical protein [Ferrimonas balearica]
MRSVLVTLLFLLALPASAALDPNLAPFEPYLNKTWRGEFSDSTPEKPVVDISTWEPALQGKAIRIRHSLNQGAYEGETFVVWNKEREQLEFFYFTSAGFYTRGTATFEGRRFVAYETVTGSDEGITEVRSEVSLNEDGTMSQQAYYLKQGEWVPGHSALYREVK